MSLRETLALRPPRVRMGRAALYALSMGTVSLTAACGGVAVGGSDAGESSESGAMSESGSPETGNGFDANCCPPYGHVPFDASPPEEQPGETAEGGTGDDGPAEGAIFPPYGLPPPPPDSGSE